MKYFLTIIIITATLATSMSDLKAGFDTACGKTMVNDGHFKHAEDNCSQTRCNDIPQKYWSTASWNDGMWMPLLTDVEKEENKMTLKVNSIASNILDKGNHEMIVSAEKDSHNNWINFKCIKKQE